jgi:mono/diheme cytochrome c family protein
MRRITALMAATISVSALAFIFVSSDASADTSAQRGKYLVQITGCNDCHTTAYAERAGDVPMADWLTGQPVGFSGPWGTSYPSNLRLSLSRMTEDQWLLFARSPRRPPMPWFALRDMSDTDLRAMYRFVCSLGVKGEAMPAAVAPGGKVRTPVIPFVPMSPEALAAANQKSLRLSQAERR